MDYKLLIDTAAFAGAGICIGLGAVGAAMGEGLTAGKGVASLARRPENSKERRLKRPYGIVNNGTEPSWKMLMI